MALARGLRVLWFMLGFPILKTGRITDPVFLSMARTYLPSEKLAIFPVTLVYVVLLYAIAMLVLRYTRYGRNVFAVGSNEYAARLAGVDVRRIKFSAYVISGALSGLAGAILVAGEPRQGRRRPGAGAGRDHCRRPRWSEHGGRKRQSRRGIHRHHHPRGHPKRHGAIAVRHRAFLLLARPGRRLILILAISIDAARIMATRRRKVVRQ